MQCVTPLIRSHRVGSKKSIIFSSKGVAQQLHYEPNWIKDRNKINRLKKSLQDTNAGWKYELIPCGKCTGCRLKYSAEWATLLMLEKLYYPDDECWFITLTYDDAHLKIPEEVEYIEGEKHETFKNDGTWSGSLYEEDVQKFIKRLRKHFPEKEIKYFYCGEYGTSTLPDGRPSLRPHYHLILFGCPFDAKEMYSNHLDQTFNRWHNKSHELDKLWGMSWITDEETGCLKDESITDMAQVEWNNCSYTARYCMKKVGNSWSPKEWFKLGKMPEYVRMSRTIGDRYYEDHKDEIWEHDSIIMKTINGKVGSIKPPKKFMRKLEKEDPVKAYQIKRKRRELVNKINQSKEFTDAYSDYENLMIKADLLSSKAGKLKREL